jgi:hypothetical protein
MHETIDGEWLKLEDVADLLERVATIQGSFQLEGISDGFSGEDNSKDFVGFAGYIAGVELGKEMREICKP